MTSRDQYRQTLRQKAEQLTTTDINGHTKAERDGFAATLKAATLTHMIDHARLAGATPEHINQLEALRPPNPATEETGNVAIDPQTMTARKDH